MGMRAAGWRLVPVVRRLVPVVRKQAAVAAVLAVLAAGCAGLDSASDDDASAGADSSPISQDSPTGQAAESEAPPASVPTTSVPVASVPAGSVPEASVPTASVPEGSAPEASVSDGSGPDGSGSEGSASESSAAAAPLPTASLPEVSAPEASVPTASVPEASVPTASVPEVSVPTVSAPAGAAALLNLLAVRAEAPRSGYDRDLFRHWIDADRDGCDTRREVLIAEAVAAPSIGSGCRLSGGRWVSRYDGQVETGSGRGFDVDHLVPLAEAWDSGAWAWDSDRRRDFANDLGYEHSLIAVSARSNRTKSASDPAEWMPAESRCWYTAAWIAVKHRWGLAADPAESRFLTGQLSDCGSAANAAAPPPVALPPPPPPPATTRPPAPTGTVPEAAGDGCHPAYTPCLPDLPGDALNCGDLTGGQKPVTVREVGVDPYRLDRDRDGRGCTS